MTTIRCGQLAFDTETALCFFDGRLIGRGDDLDVDALISALGAAHLFDDGVEAPEPTQVAFDFPTEPTRGPLPPLAPGDTLADAQQRVRAGIDKGDEVFCPCCERVACKRPRAIHAEMAKAIGRLAAYDTGRARGAKPGWHHIRDFLPDNARASKASSDMAYLVLWDAVARHPKERGVYKLRPKGIAWVEGTLALPTVAWVYAGKALHFSKELIMFEDALNQPKLFGDDNE